MSARKSSLLLVFGLMLSVDVYSAAFSVLRSAFGLAGACRIVGLCTGCEFYVSSDLDDLQPEECRELAGFTPCDAHPEKRRNSS